MHSIKLLFIGIVIGIANVIPGVSGGTLAVVFNIYDQFIEAITFNVKKIWGNRKFVFPIVIGMGLGVLIFSKAIAFLYARFPLQTNYVFTGLVIGSIPLLWKQTTKKAEGEKFSAKKIAGLGVCVAAGIALIIAFDFLEKKYGGGPVKSFDLPDFSWRLATRIFVAGIVGAIAMVIPGISGSLLMLIMGVYTIVYGAIPKMLVPETCVHALTLLLPNGVGVLLGILMGAKFINFVIKTAPNFAYAVILGLLAGSAYTLFPGIKEINSFFSALSCILCLASGIAMAYFSSKNDNKN